MVWHRTRSGMRKVRFAKCYRALPFALALLLTVTYACVKDSGNSCGEGEVMKGGQCASQQAAEQPPAASPSVGSVPTAPRFLTSAAGGSGLVVPTDVTALKSVLKPGEFYDKVSFEFTGSWLIEAGKVQTEAVITGSVATGNADVKRCAARNASKNFHNVKVSVSGDALVLTFPGGELSAEDKEAIKAVLSVFSQYGRHQVNETFQDHGKPPATFTTPGSKCFDLIYRTQTYGFPGGVIPAKAQISPSDDLGAVPTLAIFVRTDEAKSVKVASLTGSGLKYFLVSIDPAFEQYFRVDANEAPFQLAMKRLVFKAALAVPR